MSSEQKIPYFMLEEWQSEPLEKKIERSLTRIKQFHDKLDGKTYVSYSGGKDSTVLLDLVRTLYPDTPAVFFDTGVEFPEIRDMIKKTDNVDTVHPEKTFKHIITEYGYPIISKQIALQIETVRRNPDLPIAKYYLTGYKKNGEYNPRGMIPACWRFLLDAPFKISPKCCNHLKKYPVKRYMKKSGQKPFIGNMVEDSRQRRGAFLRNGCNNFTEGNENSTPMGPWTEKDVWAYIYTRNLDYCKLYDMGWDRTGCMFCLFGIHMEGKPNRIQRLYHYNPKLYDYCINKLGVGEILDYIGINYIPNHKLDEFSIEKQTKRIDE